MIKAMATGPDGRKLFATEIAKVRVRQTRLGSNGLPTRVIDMTGLSVGRFEVLGWAGINRDGRSLWRCLCECGIQRLVLGKDLRNGKMVSCGCYRVDLRIETNLTHGMTDSGTYRSYRAMLDRCYNAKQRTYAYYGALGVIVCERWRDGFEAFYDDMGERPTAMSLDRRNPFGNYEPSNCRWSTKKNQMSNQRRDVAFAVVRSLLCGGFNRKDNPMSEMLPIPLEEQINELHRELQIRRRVYPRFVADGKMTQAKADRQIAALEAAAESLQLLKGLEQ